MRKDRFESVTSCEELARVSKGFVPCNTKANTEWSLKSIKAWQEWKNRERHGITWYGIIPPFLPSGEVL